MLNLTFKVLIQIKISKGMYNSVDKKIQKND